MMVNASGLDFPEYEDLPELVKGYKCSWEYFRQFYPSTVGLGALNFITTETRLAGLQESVCGRSISLDLPLDHFASDSTAFGGRPPPKHKLLSSIGCCFEDQLDFNTQSASQWDGFRHFGLPARNRAGPCIFFNGWNAEELKMNTELGIDAWVSEGAIAGRAVLIDFARWSDKTQPHRHPNQGYSITVADIEAVLNYQNTTIRPGDILIFRTGWIDWYNSVNPSVRHEELCLRNAPGCHSFIGLEASRDFVSWLWNHRIAAVAGDQPAFESTPFKDDGFGSLHEHLLAALGCPVGELWDTEQLSLECEKKNSWSFFLVSSPLHVKGGVASPANAVAVL